MKNIKTEEKEILTDPSLSPRKIDYIHNDASETDIHTFINNPKLLKQDILLFKNEVLKDLKIFMRQISDKVSNDEKLVNEKLDKFNTNIQTYTERIHELSNLICTDKTIRDKVDIIMNFKQKAQETLMTNDIKMNNFDKDFHENIFRIDSILKETVLYPGIIGGISKFKNFHDLIDFILSEISQITTFKEKTTMDINAYKSKVENITQSLQIKIDNNNLTCTKYLQKCIKSMEEKFQSLLDLYDEKLTAVRMENTKYIEDIKKATKKLMDETNNILLMKKDLMKKFDEEVKFLKNDNVRVIKCFSGYKENFNKMRLKFRELCEFIRDVRFKVNLGEELKTSDFRKMSKRIAVSPNIRKTKTAIIEECEEFLQINKKNIKPFRRASVATPNNMFNILNEEEFDRRRNNVLNSINEMDNESTVNNITGEKKEYECFLKEYLKNDESKKEIQRQKSKKIKEKHEHHHRHHHHHHRHNHKKKNIDKKKSKNIATNHIFLSLKLDPLKDSEKIPEFRGRTGKYRKTMKIERNDIFTKINNLKTIFKISPVKDRINEEKSEDDLSFSNSSRSKSSSKYSKSNSRSSSSSSSSSKSDSSSSNSSDYSVSSKKSDKKEKKNKKIFENIEVEKDVNNSKEQSDNKKMFDEKNKNKLKNKDLTGDQDNINNMQISDEFCDIKNGNLNKKNVLNSYKVFDNDTSINNYVNKKDDSQPITLRAKILKKEKSALLENKKSSISQTDRNKNINNLKQNNNTIKKISMSVDGANKVVLNPLKTNNDKVTLNVVKNVKVIVDKNRKLIPNKTYSGFPKIVSNQGERIIVASHPVFHSKKFSTYTSPNVIALNHSIQTLYGKKIKKNIAKKQNYFEKINGSSNKIVINSQSEKKGQSNNLFNRAGKNLNLPQNSDLEILNDLNSFNKQGRNKNEFKVIEKNDNLFGSVSERNKNIYRMYDGSNLRKDDGGGNRYYNLMLSEDKKIP